MNIKQHIEAGHYECTSKGHALVPTRDGSTAIICATDMPGARPILGWIPTPAIARAISIEWQANGMAPLQDGLTLLPPAPRKVEVKLRGVFGKPSGAFCGAYPRSASDDYIHKYHGESVTRIVELTGSYEMPWPEESQS